MIAKMKPVEQGGSRLAIVFNGSPLFTGAAGSGESEIRRWIIENDWLEAVVALPDQLFYNTGISTYFWVVTNRKRPERRGKVQLVDARELFEKMRKSLGEKRKEVSPEQIAEITRLYGDFTGGERVKILPNEAFGFLRITVERPLRLRWEVSAETLAAVESAKGLAKLDEDVAHGADRRAARPRRAERRRIGRRPGRLWTRPLGRSGCRHRRRRRCGTRSRSAMPMRHQSSTRRATRSPTPSCATERTCRCRRCGWCSRRTRRSGCASSSTARRSMTTSTAEVFPYVPDAWVDHAKTKVGYEIPLTRHFYKYMPPRPLAEIDAEIKALEAEIQKLLREVTE